MTLGAELGVKIQIIVLWFWVIWGNFLCPGSSFCTSPLENSIQNSIELKNSIQIVISSLGNNPKPASVELYREWKPSANKNSSNKNSDSNKNSFILRHLPHFQLQKPKKYLFQNLHCPSFSVMQILSLFFSPQFFCSFWWQWQSDEGRNGLVDVTQKFLIFNSNPAHLFPLFWFFIPILLIFPPLISTLLIFFPFLLIFNPNPAHISLLFSWFWIPILLIFPLFSWFLIATLLIFSPFSSDF